MKKSIEIYNAFGKDTPEAALNQMNCAEVLLRAANDDYEFNLSEDCYQMIQGFGGGFYSERTCGAFSGAMAALGLLYSEQRPTKQEKIKKAAQILVKEFEEEFGSLNCDEIKEKYRDPVEACNPVKLRTGEVLKRVIKKMEK